MYSPKRNTQYLVSSNCSHSSHKDGEAKIKALSSVSTAEEADVMDDAYEEMEGVGMLLSNHHVEGTITSPQEEEAHSIR